MDIYTGPVGSANLTQQIHDYSPGISPNGLFWVISVPTDVVEVDPGAGKASLHMNNLPVMDAHDIANALTGGHGLASPSIPPIAPVAATVSFDIEWSGVIERAIITNDDEDFTGEFVRTGATIEWSSSESGFQFTSEPANPTRNIYSVVGHERNGVFFHGRH
jgi:hypothetical protein